MNRNQRHKAARAGLLFALIAALLGGAAASSQANQDGYGGSTDLSAAAFPSAARPQVLDTAYDNSRAAATDLRADASATASTTCDSCHGDAATLQILYVSRPRNPVFNNSAVAWAACANCRATAVSVQLVVVRGGQGVTANNRALAVGATCQRCVTSALAIQLVVLDPDGSRLSDRAVLGLRDWVRQRAAELRSQRAQPDGRRLFRRQTVTPLRNLVNADLGSRTLVSHVSR